MSKHTLYYCDYFEALKRNTLNESVVDGGVTIRLISKTFKKGIKLRTKEGE